MDRAVRSVTSVGPVRVVLVACALLGLVPFGTGIGDAAQGDGATPGASPVASPAASPSASPVAGAAVERGSLTVRLLACDDATTVAGFDPARCDAISGDAPIEIAGSGGDPLTVDDALRVSGGVFRWARIPYGVYTVSLATLPGGAGTVVAVVGDDEAPEEVTAGGAEVTVDAADSDPTVSLYLLSA